MKQIVLANKEYNVPDLDFNAVCDLADKGVDIMNPKAFSNNPIMTARSITAWMLGITAIEAGQVIQDHVLDGGDIADIFTVFNEVVDESGFIQALQKRGAKRPQDRKRKAQ